MNVCVASCTVMQELVSEIEESRETQREHGPPTLENQNPLQKPHTFSKIHSQGGTRRREQIYMVPCYVT